MNEIEKIKDVLNGLVEIIREVNEKCEKLQKQVNLQQEQITILRNDLKKLTP